MTKDELISIACRWMDKHNSDPHYIQSTAAGYTFICGTYQTDLRSFLTSVKDLPYWDAVDILNSKQKI